MYLGRGLMIMPFLEVDFSLVSQWKHDPIIKLYSVVYLGCNFHEDEQENWDLLLLRHSGASPLVAINCNCQATSSNL